MAYKYLAEDIDRIGRCDFTLAKKSTECVLLALPVVKKSPYEEQFDLGYVKKINLETTDYIHFSSKDYDHRSIWFKLSLDQLRFSNSEAMHRLGPTN